MVPPLQSPIQIAVFVPAYNAAATLESVLSRLSPQDWQQIAMLLIIDDGSSDNTFDIATDLAASNNKITVVQHEQNRGYGHTVQQGMTLSADCDVDYVACLHSDGQYPPECILPFAQHMKQNDIDLLQGSRHLGGGALQGGMPLYKYLAGKALTALENTVFGLKMTDYHSGFIVYRREVLQAVPLNTLSTYFDFDLELIASAHQRGFVIGELPIPTRYCGEISYLNPVVYGFRVLGIVIKYMAGRYRPASASRVDRSTTSKEGESFK